VVTVVLVIVNDIRLCMHFYCTYPVTWNKRVTNTTLIYSPQCHTYPVTYYIEQGGNKHETRVSFPNI